MILIVLVVILLVLYFYWNESIERGQRPPGPFRIPIIGNLHQLAATGCKLPFLTFDILSKKYGPIISLKVGMTEIIILSTIEEMHALLKGDELSGRALQLNWAIRNFDKYSGIIINNGERWKELRRFTVRTLRDFGFGKTLTMESVMAEEADDLVEITKAKALENNGKVRIELFFQMHLLNVLWTMVAGKKFASQDPKLMYLVDLNKKVFEAGNFGADLAIAFPFLRHVLPSLTGATTYRQLIPELQRYFRDIFHEHKNRGAYKTDPQCFVDVFLRKSEAEEGPDSDSIYTEEEFIVILLDLFQTGTETLAGSLSYGLLFMALNLEAQRKVHEEIDREISHGSQISLSQRDKMVYTQATILEILRLGNVVPIAPPRMVLQDFIYNGQRFKKGTTVIFNMHSVFKNPNYFPDPETFKPERFISDSGCLFNTEVVSTAFGFGKRVCMGETLAEASLFMFFTTLMRNFELSTVSDEPPPTTVPLPAFTLSPQPFNIIFKPRD